MRLFRGRQCFTVEELMRKALLFVIVTALFFESETNRARFA